MITPDERILKSIAELNGNPFFEAIKKWVEDSYQEYANQIQKIDPDTVLRRTQGAMIELKTLKTTFATARDILETMGETDNVSK